MLGEKCGLQADAGSQRFHDGEVGNEFLVGRLITGGGEDSPWGLPAKAARIAAQPPNTGGPSEEALRAAAGAGAEANRSACWHGSLGGCGALRVAQPTGAWRSEAR